MVNILIILLTTTSGAFLTFEISNKFKLSKVTTSATLSFIFASFFHFFPTIVSPGLTHLLPAAFFGATFNGMTAEKVIFKNQILLSGVLFGLIFIFITPYFAGFGGGLGISACISIITTLGLKILVETLLVFYRRKSQNLLKEIITPFRSNRK